MSRRVQDERGPRPLRWLSPGLFGVIALCFFLPFLSVSCQVRGDDVELATFTGLDMLLGTPPQINPALIEAVESDGTSAVGRGARQPFAIVAAVAALAGLGLSFVRRRWGRTAAGGAALIGIASLIVLRFRIAAQFAEASSGQQLGVEFRASYDIGYWLALILFALTAALQGVLLVLSARRSSSPARAGPRAAPGLRPG